MSNVFFKFNSFGWEGIKKIDYKSTDGDMPITFNDITRQNLVENRANTSFHLRYFECAKGGFSTLEKHEHVHVVMIARGKGKVIVNHEIFEARPMDLFVVPPFASHQLINVGEEPFGFFCTVDAIRDKFVLLSKDEIEDLKKSAEIASFIQIPDRYFD
jgi:mannose-6-phosphate isomerase-like protein (cupin superfamily)